MLIKAQFITGHLTARSDVYGFGVVLLEMLLGIKAVDKNRSSRDYNLVDWARPLLVNTKKLFKVLDPRMEGQYANKVAIEVSALAYRCLSQNPKGRPTMDQVVEILQNIQNLPESKEEMLLRIGGSAVTLYEAPIIDNENKEVNEPNVHARRKTKHGNGRSKSEPPVDFILFSPSPGSDRQHRDIESKSSRRRIAKPSFDQVYDV